MDPAIVYPFVFDADTWRTVAHAAFPDRLDLIPASIMAYYDLDEISEMLAESKGAWISYKFYNPITDLVEYKRTWLSLHDGYIFAAGYYHGNFDQVEGIIAGAIADYDANGDAAFDAINSEMSSSLDLSAIVLDHDTLDVVAHSGYPGLVGRTSATLRLTGRRWQMESGQAWWRTVTSSWPVPPHWIHELVSQYPSQSYSNCTTGTSLPPPSLWSTTHNSAALCPMRPPGSMSP